MLYEVGMRLKGAVRSYQKEVGVLLYRDRSRSRVGLEQEINGLCITYAHDLTDFTGEENNQNIICAHRVPKSGEISW